MLLSVIVPTYNEAGTILELIEKVRKVPINKEIIVVNDGSNDGSREKLDTLVGTDGIKIIHHEQNAGKGMAIRTGRKHISGDIVIMQDADLETDPNDYLHLVQPIIDGKTKVVYGSRLLEMDAVYSWKYYLGGRVVTLFANLLYNQGITDEPTCYKVFDTEFFQSIPLECTGFEFCPEITAKVSKRGEKIIELPMKYYPRSMDEGKKIRAKDGLIAIWTLLKYRF